MHNLYKKNYFFLFLFIFPTHTFDNQQSQVSFIPVDMWNVIFSYVNFKSKKCLEITCKFFNHCFKVNSSSFLNNNELGLTLHSCINALYLYKNNSDFFAYFAKNCSQEHIFVLQGFDCFKSKRNKTQKIDVSDTQLLCESIIANNDQKYVKFFIPYSVVSWTLGVLKQKKPDQITQIAQFEVAQKIVSDVSKIFNEKILVTNFYDFYLQKVEEMRQYYNAPRWNGLLDKALSKGNLNVVIFMCKIFPSMERLIDIVNKAEGYEKLKMLMQADVTMFPYAIPDEDNDYAIQEQLCKGNIDRARIILQLVFEQGKRAKLPFSNQYEFITINYERMSILPYLLANQASDVIRLLFKSDFRHINKWHVDGATHEQVKEIVTLMHEIYKNEAPSKINKYLFLHTAVEANDITLVQFLLDYGANINESCMSNINFQYPPIGYSLNNDEMIDFFINNIHLLDKGKVEFFDWKKPYQTANIKKLIEKDYFCEGEVFSFICKAIQLNDILLHELVFKNKKLVNEYKALDAWGKHALFRKAVDKKDKKIINLFRYNGFNMFEKFVINHSSKPALNNENKECLRRSLSFIDHKYIIQDYEKHKQNMTCEQYLCVLDICKDHGVLRDHLLKNDDIGKINLLPMILSEEIIEKRINQILDRPLFKKKSLFNWFAAKNIKNLLLRDQQHLRLIE